MPSCRSGMAFLFIETMEIKSALKIGFILKPHGLKGEVTISLDVSAPEDMESLQSVFLEKDNRLIPYFIEAISVRGPKAFIKFEDVNSLEMAAEISRQGIYIPKPERAKSKQGEFYPDEVIGYKVSTESDELIGIIKEVMEEGPNPMLVLDHDNKEVLIPLNSPFIENVDKRKKQIVVNLPEGFLDI
jgi:16S rRNA processing protein RimM